MPSSVASARYPRTASSARHRCAGTHSDTAPRVSWPLCNSFLSQVCQLRVSQSRGSVQLLGARQMPPALDLSQSYLRFILYVLSSRKDFVHFSLATWHFELERITTRSPGLCYLVTLFAKLEAISLEEFRVGRMVAENRSAIHTHWSSWYVQ
jgi:hypothetical protein